MAGLAWLGGCGSAEKAPAKQPTPSPDSTQRWIDDKLRAAREGHVDPDFAALLAAQTQRKMQAGDFPGALRTAEPLAQLTEIVHGPNDPNTAASLEMLADIYCNLDRCAESVTLLERAGTIYQQSGEDGRVSYVRTLNSIGASWNLLGQPDRAEPVLKESLSRSEQIFGANSPQVGITYWLLMNTYTAQGKSNEAAAAKARAEKLLQAR